VSKSCVGLMIGNSKSNHLSAQGTINPSSVGQRTGVFRTENHINRSFEQGEKPPDTGGSSPWMQPLVFWPRAGAFGAGAILELCAQLVWCELYGNAGFTRRKRALVV